MLPLALASISGSPCCMPPLDGMPGIFGMMALSTALAPLNRAKVMENGSVPFGSR
ncbi:hypothetical protein D3C79_1069650 [compost metagenome]